MKELTAEEKAKVYDEIVDRAKKELDACGSQDCDAAKQIFRLFPELKENEDERIRKELIKYFKKYQALSLGDYNVQDIIAWLEKQGKNNMGISEFTKQKLETNLHKALEKETYESWEAILEKQGEQKPYGQRQECFDCQMNYAGECKGSCAMKRDEQTPADNAEPKFKIGDWVVYDHRAYQVVELPKEGYINLGLRGNGKIEFAPSTYCRHWTIQEAKEGDALVASDKSLFIYDGSINENGSVGFHIALTEDMDIILNSDDGCGWEEKDSCHPATKEQRDLLFSKMKEAGYEWNNDTKQLKKIEQKPNVNCLLSWSETDEKMLQSLEGIVKDYWAKAEQEKNEIKIREASNVSYFLKTIQKSPLCWIKCSDRLPNRDGIYLVVTDGLHNEIYDMARYDSIEGWHKASEIIYWMPIPQLNNKSIIEQKPTWSEEDEKVIQCLDYAVRHFYEDKYTIKWCCDWLKSLKPQPKQEWSEEDEYNVAFIVETLLGLDGDKEYLSKYKSMANWLKSLKERYTWEPSDEQMNALREAVIEMGKSVSRCNIEEFHEIESLYNDLKKLKQ